MLSGSLPYARSYPPVTPIRFEASPCGWRTSDELAEFLRLSPLGLKGYRENGGRCRPYGPRYACKTTPAVPAGGYSDIAVAEWLCSMLMTERDWLSFYQHKHPSEANKAEAKASMDSMIAADRLMKQ